MGLNPSNGIAAAMNPGKTMFPNLARRQPFDPKDIEEVSRQCKIELLEAEIPIPDLEFDPTGEVPSKWRGFLYGWQFRRAWYYWIAEGDGIPLEDAEKLHKDFGTQVRVEGHCGCPSPLEWKKGAPITSYHVDTKEGLKALAQTIRDIRKRGVALLVSKIHAGEIKVDKYGMVLERFDDGSEDVIYLSETLGIVREHRKKGGR
jgi:hypothetical protein